LYQALTLADMQSCLIGNAAHMISTLLQHLLNRNQKIGKQMVAKWFCCNT